jgi:pyocin large subunit-like protein
MKNGTIYKYSSKLEIIVLDEKNNQTRQIKESWDTDSGVHKNEGTYLYNERKANAPTSAR